MDKRKFAIEYLTQRYHEQRLWLFFPVEQYVNANLQYVLNNIKNGLCKAWIQAGGE